MPDHLTPHREWSHLAALELVATEAVTGVAGVGTIEPSLSQAVRNLRRFNPEPAPAAGTAHASPGLGGSVNVAVEIGVTSNRSAYETAQDVRATLTQLLADHGQVPGHVTVSVLHLYDSRPAA